MVKAWRETVTIPTYECGKPEKNPMFLEKRVYQGSSGVVYPYPVIETMSDQFQEDNSVQISSFGTFEIKKKMERIMINPSTGQRMLVPPKLVLTFKPNMSWKERVKSGGTE